MRKRLGFILIASALTAFLFLPAFSQEDMVVVDSEGFNK